MAKPVHYVTAGINRRFYCAAAEGAPSGRRTTNIAHTTCLECVLEVADVLQGLMSIFYEEPTEGAG